MKILNGFIHIFLANIYLSWYYKSVYLIRFNYFLEVIGWILCCFCLLGFFRVIYDYILIDIGVEQKVIDNLMVMYAKSSSNVFKSYIHGIVYFITALFSLIMLDDKSLFFLFMIIVMYAGILLIMSDKVKGLRL